MKNVFLKNCFLYNWATQYNPDSYDPFPANTPVSKARAKSPRNIINSHTKVTKDIIELGHKQQDRDKEKQKLFYSIGQII